jgi:hypothetical protein
MMRRMMRRRMRSNGGVIFFSYTRQKFSVSLSIYCVPELIESARVFAHLLTSASKASTPEKKKGLTMPNSNNLNDRRSTGPPPRVN